MISLLAGTQQQSICRGGSRQTNWVEGACRAWPNTPVTVNIFQGSGVPHDVVKWILASKWESAAWCTQS